MSEVFQQLSPPVIPAQPLEPSKLTAEQEKMYQEVYEHFTKEGYTLPEVKENAQLQEMDKFWLTYECMLRYLRATKWKVPAAIQRLETTLKWRREFGIETTVNSKHVEPEALTGKEILFGYDVHGRPAFYMIPSRQNTTESHRQVEFAFFILERAVDLMPKGVESIALLIDFSDRGKNPSMSTSRTVLNILQEHYPERLGVALIAHVPYLVNLFFKLIMPFVDPVTRAKVKFNPDAVKDGIFAPDNVMSRSWGGSAVFTYEHDKYWPHMVKMAEERKTANLQCWRELGGSIGLKESDYKDSAPIPIPGALAGSKAEADPEKIEEPVVQAEVEKVQELVVKVKKPGAEETSAIHATAVVA